MSLKAKLEAVIYAAEEPVTLAQLAALFAADALEWKAEQQTAAADAAETAEQATDPTPLLAQGLEYLGLEQTPAFYAVIPPQAPTADLESSAEPADSSPEPAPSASDEESSSPARRPRPQTPRVRRSAPPDSATVRSKSSCDNSSTNSPPRMPLTTAAWRFAKLQAAIA